MGLVHIRAVFELTACIPINGKFYAWNMGVPKIKGIGFRDPKKNGKKKN